jgi:hypothetical protein
MPTRFTMQTLEQCGALCSIGVCREPCLRGDEGAHSVHGCSIHYRTAAKQEV